MLLTAAVSAAQPAVHPAKSEIPEEGNSSAGSVTFGVLTDTHISELPIRVQNNRLDTALRYFARSGAVSTFICGDLTTKGTALQFMNYAAVVDFAETGDMTVHECFGNHDSWGSVDAFLTYTKEPLNNHLKINGYHFITLSPDPNEDGSYDINKPWLSEQLAIAAADTGSLPIFVFAHHPVKDTIYVSRDWYGNLTQSDFNDYPQVVFFTGHSHAPNNNPLSIWQDGFTAVNAGTLAKMELERGVESTTHPDGCDDVAQGLLVHVSGSKVTITNHDFISGLDIEEQTWVFDTADLKKGDPASFPYNNEIRAKRSKAPVFTKSAKITIDRYTSTSVTFTFDQAKIASEDAGDIVHTYRFMMYAEDGSLLAQEQSWSDFYFYPMPDRLTRTISDLEENSGFTLKIYPCNAYGLEGEPLTVTYKPETGKPSGGGGGGGGGSSSPSGTVTVTNSAHGTVSADAELADPGQTVTLLVSPDAGYRLTALRIADAKGGEIRQKELGNGRYSFIMPRSDVTVSAVFEKDETVIHDPFTDVAPDCYYYDAVLWAVENGITKGVGGARFGSESPTTRAQVVTFLWRAAGCPEPVGSAAKFADVVKGSYYEKAAAWAIEQKITNGTSSSSFSPNAVCTRAQIVTFLARFAGAAGTASGSDFTDVNPTDYFAFAVQWAKESGVTGGVSGRVFAPYQPCTRAQVVTFLYRWMVK